MNRHRRLYRPNNDAHPGAHTAPAAVSVHIERLVLQNLPAPKGRRLVARVENELARLLTEYGVPDTWERVSGRAKIGAERPPARIGRRQSLGTGIARAIYRTPGP